MGNPQSTGSLITYSTTGICTQTAFITPGECNGAWTTNPRTCSEWKPTFTSTSCLPGTWKAVPGQTRPPFTVVTTTAPPATTTPPPTTPAPTPDPACACTSGQGCAQSTCNSCVISKVCTKVFPTKEECLIISNNAGKWCGN